MCKETTQEAIDRVVQRHGLRARWVKSAGGQRLWVTQNGWNRWVDTTIYHAGDGTWYTDMAPITEWHRLHRTRAVAAGARPYWAQVKPCLTEILSLFSTKEV